MKKESVHNKAVKKILLNLTGFMKTLNDDEHQVFETKEII